jgi:hypothetical protein
MSGNGETPFFDSPDLAKVDGTLADVTGDRFSDPLSGLVTAGAVAQPVTPGVPEENHAQVPGPVHHDPEVVSRMVNAAMMADEEPETPPARPVKAVNTVGEQSTPPLGMLPRQRTWPTRAPQLLRPPRKQKQDSADEVDDETEFEVHRAKRSMSMPRFGKPSSNTAGVMVAIALMIIFAVLAIQLLTSLFNSIAGLFS